MNWIVAAEAALAVEENGIALQSKSAEAAIPEGTGTRHVALYSAQTTTPLAPRLLRGAAERLGRADVSAETDTRSQPPAFRVRMANTAGVTRQAIPRIDRSRLGYASSRVRFSHPGISRSQKGTNVLTISDSAENILRRELSDRELEIAAEELAMSYTYQTSAYNRCC